MEENSEEYVRARFVQVLARAATDPAFFQKLKADPAKTLEEEGVDQGGFFIPVSDKAILDGILRVYDDLGGVICKKR